MFLLEDKLLNDRLIREYSTEHDNVLNARISRMQSALTQHMGTIYAERPKPLLQHILDRIANYELRYSESLSQSASQRWLDKKQKAQNLIDTQQYAQENTPDHDYHVNYYIILNNFVWPDANELTIRQQEEAELMALLN